MHCCRGAGPRRESGNVQFVSWKLREAERNKAQIAVSIEDGDVRGLKKTYKRIPLPKGEGAAKRRVRGTTKNTSFLWNPSPGLRPPSPFGRGIRPETFSN